MESRGQFLFCSLSYEVYILHHAIVHDKDTLSIAFYRLFNVLCVRCTMYNVLHVQYIPGAKNMGI